MIIKIRSEAIEIIDFKNQRKIKKKILGDTLRSVNGFPDTVQDITKLYYA